MRTYSWVYIPPQVEIGAEAHRVGAFTVRQLWHAGVVLGACLVSLERGGVSVPVAAHSLAPSAELSELPVTFIDTTAEEAQPSRVLAVLDAWLYHLRTLRYVDQMNGEQESKPRQVITGVRETPTLSFTQLLPWLLQERRPLDFVVQDEFAVASKMLGFRSAFGRHVFEDLEKSRATANPGANERFSHHLSARKWSKWLAAPVDIKILQGDVLWRAAAFVIYRIWVESIDGRLNSPQFRVLHSDIPSEWHGLLEVDDDNGMSHRLTSWMAAAGDQYTLADVLMRIRRYWLRPEMASLRLLAHELKHWPPDGDQSMQEKLHQVYVERRRRVSRVLRTMRALSAKRPQLP